MLPVRSALLVCPENSGSVKSTTDVACRSADTRLTKL